MQCPEENVIVDFLRGDLGDPAREGVEAHLDGCPSCCRMVADLARIFRSSDAWGATLGGTEPLEPASSLGDTGLPCWNSAPILPEGSKLGRYVVLHRVGAGGMGIVYAAYDPELDRKVALKLLIGSGAGSSQKVRADQRTRLLREAQAMARLSHPNVITVHDVGTFEGQVFLAMEFVDGCTLKAWLQAKVRRSWREILEVFAAAGRGLAAAHAAGLIHRDFKPDNVLLACGPDDRPERVLVTDFGLARPARGQTDAFAAVGTTLPSGQQVLSAQLTQTGALVGTPAYMAPEQLAGERIDALSDQFSFCVALYEGLYGKRPFAGKALPELIANVCEGRLRSMPRDANVPRWLRRALLRGLSTEALDRYPDVDALLIALERDPWRSWRRWGTVLLPGGVLAIGIAAHQRDLPARDGYCADVDRRLQGVWDADRRQRIEAAFMDTGKPFAAHSFKSVASALDAYATRWVSLQHASCEAQARGDEPGAVLALRMSCLGHHLDTLGMLTDVLTETDADTVERALDAVLRLPDPAVCEDVDRLTLRLGMLEAPGEAESEGAEILARAQVLRDAGRYEDALDAARRAVSAANEAGSDRIAAEALQILAIGLELTGRIPEAEDTYHEALTLALRVDHPVVIARVAIGLTWLSNGADGDLASAERWARHGLAATARMGGEPELEAQLQNALGMAYLEHDRFVEAQTCFRNGLAIREAAFGPDHASLSEPLNAMGQLLGKQGEHPQAAEYFERARRLMEREYGPQHPNTAAAIGNLGVTYGRMGQVERARMAHEEALAIRLASLGPDHPHTATSHYNIAVAFMEQGLLDDALAHNLQALAIYRRVFGGQSLDVATALGNIAAIEHQRGRLDDAQRYHRQALTIVRELLGDDHPKTARYEQRLAEVLVEADHDRR
jgi:eukaryotic-like serine/threonine-protein kinase